MARRFLGSFRKHAFQPVTVIVTPTPVSTPAAQAAPVLPSITTPNAFSLTAVTGVPVLTLETSNTITISGLSGGVFVAASVSGGQLSKNGGAFTASATSVQNGDTLAVQHTSSASPLTAVNTILTVGGVSSTFTSTTAATAANSLAPSISGVPREGQAAWLSAGEWTIAANYYRFKIYRDGVLVSTVTQAADAFERDWVTADAGTVASMTVEASPDSGATYSSPVTADINFSYQTDIIEPASIPAGTLTRTSLNTVIPMTFDVTATVYPSYQWQIQVLDLNFIEKYNGFKPVTEAELTSPFNMDLSGATGPLPVPTMPALLATDILRLRLVSQDYMHAVSISDDSGVFQPWMAISPTDRAGSRYWKLSVASGQFFLNEIELALSVGGVNTALYAAYTFSDPPPYSGNFDPRQFFDKRVNNGALYTPGSVLIDYGVNVQPGELRLVNWVAANGPTNFILAHSSDNVTYSTDLNISGLTWLDAEIKTRTLGAGAAVTFDPTTGVNKNSAVVLSSGNLELTAPGGTLIYARATRAASPSAFECEFTVNSTTYLEVGVNDGTQDFTTAGVTPGSGNSTGITLRWDSSQWATYRNGGITANNGVVTAPAIGSKVTMRGDKAAQTIRFYLNGTLLYTETGVTFWTVHGGGKNSWTDITANFAGPFSYFTDSAY